MARYRIFVVGALALVASSAPASARPFQAGYAQTVAFEAVTEETVQRTERVIGSLRAHATATLAALEEGPLVELFPREADRVAAKEIVARTDTRRLAATRLEQVARIAEAEAMVGARSAELKNRELDLTSKEAAARENAVSQRDLRNARTAVETGQAELSASRETVAALTANLALLDARLHDAEVRSPFDAIVITRHAEPGEWVRPGDPLLTVQSKGTVEAWLQLPERLLGELKLDPTKTHVEFMNSSETHPVTRLRVLPQVDARARTFYLIADIDDADGSLFAGMSVTAWIPVGAPSKELLVPKDALVRRDQSTYVQRIVSENGTESSQPVAVRIRFELDRHVAVERGDLAAGDRVVVEGNERLLPGGPVIANPAVDAAAQIRNREVPVGDGQ